MRQRVLRRGGLAALTLALAACLGSQAGGEAVSPVVASKPAMTHDVLRAHLVHAATTLGLIGAGLCRPTARAHRA